MVDNSKSAKRDGEALASEMELNEIAKFEIQNVLLTDEYLPSDPRFNFIEVVGMLDYLDSQTDIDLLSDLRKSLVPGGVLFFSNIAPNDEETLLWETVLWPPMYYRTADELLDLGKAAGFEASSMRLIREPLGIYNIVAATK